jgi:hypothetical protein
MYHVDIVLLQFVFHRTLLQFVSGGLLCLACCLLIPLPETLLYDLPDTLTDVHSMQHTAKTEHIHDRSASHYHMIDANTVACPRLVQDKKAMPSTSTDVQDLLSLNPQVIFPTSTHVIDDNAANERKQTLVSSNSLANHSVTSQCYFASVTDTIDQHHVEQPMDTRMMMINRRAVQHTTVNHNNSNNNHHQKYEQNEITKL